MLSNICSPRQVEEFLADAEHQLAEILERVAHGLNEEIVEALRADLKRRMLEEPFGKYQDVASAPT